MWPTRQRRMARTGQPPGAGGGIGQRDQAAQIVTHQHETFYPQVAQQLMQPAPQVTRPCARPWRGAPIARQVGRDDAPAGQPVRQAGQTAPPEPGGRRQPVQQHQRRTGRGAGQPHEDRPAAQRDRARRDSSLVHCPPVVTGWRVASYNRLQVGAATCFRQPANAPASRELVPCNLPTCNPPNVCANPGIMCREASVRRAGAFVVPPGRE